MEMARTTQEVPTRPSPGSSAGAHYIAAAESGREARQVPHRRGSQLKRPLPGYRVYLSGFYGAGAEPMRLASCEERVTQTVRPKCEIFACGDVELGSGEIDVDVEIGDPSEDEGRCVPRKVAEPRMPTQVEIEEHNITHLPYRFWCIHCVRGRGEQAGHLRQEERPEKAIPEVHMDYCFMERKSDDVQPMLVARDRDTRMTVSFLVQKKGAVDDYVIRRLLQFLRELGYRENKVVVRSDQESPMRAVAEKLAKERGEAQTILEHSPVRSWGSNGVERASKSGVPGAP